MRFVTLFLAGAVAGAALTYFGSRSAPDDQAASSGSARERAQSAAALEEELERLRKESLRLRIELERAGRSSRGDGSGAPSSTDGPRVAREPLAENHLRSLDDRALVARRTLAMLERDPELARFHERHSWEENAFPRWSSTRFLADPAINPARMELDEVERQEFERLYARAYLRMRRMDLERRLLMTEAALLCVEEQLWGRDDCLHGLPPGRAHFVHVPTDLTLILPREECPEIDVLQDEIQAAVIEWFHEARDFMARLGH